MQAYAFASSPFGSRQSSAAMYTRVGAETGVVGASPHRLVALLFEGFMDAVAQARGAMRAGQIEAKGRAIRRAARIVDEGLKAALNLEGGGNLANDLNDLYAYVTMRLTQANIRNDEQSLQECVQLMQSLADAWDAIGAQVAGARG